MDDDKKLSTQNLTKLLKTDMIEAEKAMNALDISGQVELFMHSGDHDRLRWVQLSYHPRALLAAIPATEIWMTIKRMSPHDAHDLIRYSPPDKLQIIYDIEWWQKDRMESASILEWLDYISLCGIGKMMEFFKENDWDQIQWFFKQNVVVYKIADKEEDPSSAIQWPRDDEAPITHEGVYFFQVLDETHDRLIRHFLEILVKHDMDLYRSLCETCLWEMPSLQEEAAFEIRSRRLAEEGFPTFDDAIQVYAPLNKSRFHGVPKRPVGETESMAPRYPLAVMGDRVLFINRALSGLDSVMENHFLKEIALISNKVLVADGEMIDEDCLKGAIGKAIGYVNIGLEVLSEGDLERAKQLLKEHWLVHIFQVGLSEVLAVGREAQKLFKGGWFAEDEKRLVLLEPHEQFVMMQLMRKRPKRFVGGEVSDPESTRDFAELREIRSTRETMAEISFWGRLVQHFFSEDFRSLLEWVDRPEELRLTGVANTTFINGYQNGQWIMRPVEPKALHHFVSTLHLNEGSEQLDRELAIFKAYLSKEHEPLAENEGKFLDRFISLCQGRLMDELGSLREVPKPEYIQCVWMDAT